MLSNALEESSGSSYFVMVDSEAQHLRAVCCRLAIPPQVAMRKGQQLAQGMVGMVNGQPLQQGLQHALKDSKLQVDADVCRI